MASYALGGSPGVIYNPDGYGQWVAVDPVRAPEADRPAQEPLRLAQQQAHNQSVPQKAQDRGKEVGTSVLHPNQETISGVSKSYPVEQNPAGLDECIESVAQLHVEEFESKLETKAVMPAEEEKVPLNMSHNGKNHSMPVSLSPGDAGTKSSGPPELVYHRFGAYETSDPILASWMHRIGRSSYTK